jgi:hypothetical protein
MERAGRAGADGRNAGSAPIEKSFRFIAIRRGVGKVASFSRSESEFRINGISHRLLPPLLNGFPQSDISSGECLCSLREVESADRAGF